MGKIKTHQATAKRITITKTKKIKHRKCGQDHFNSRESGNTVRKKRRDVSVENKKKIKTIKALMPYN